MAGIFVWTLGDVVGLCVLGLMIIGVAIYCLYLFLGWAFQRAIERWRGR